MRTLIFVALWSSIVFIQQVQAKNAIVFIGDGMGITTITAARIFEGQQLKKDGEKNALSFEKFPNFMKKILCVFPHF